MVNYIKSEIERQYNMTLAKDGEESQNGETTCYAYGVIGDRTIAVLVHSTSDTVRVGFMVFLTNHEQGTICPCYYKELSASVTFKKVGGRFYTIG